MARRWHVPQRTCIACRQVRNKRDLLRVVRTPEGEIVVDPTGKRSGRGAYLCRAQSCWQAALSANGRRLSQALRMDLPPDAIERLQEVAAGLPAQLPTPSAAAEGQTAV